MRKTDVTIDMKKVLQLSLNQYMGLAELARKADVSYTTLYKLQTNQARKASLRTITKVARALSVAPKEISTFDFLE